jgi:hypothetical protein
MFWKQKITVSRKTKGSSPQRAVPALRFPFSGAFHDVHAARCGGPAINHGKRQPEDRGEASELPGRPCRARSWF